MELLYIFTNIINREQVEFMGKKLKKKYFINLELKNNSFGQKTTNLIISD